MMRIKKFLALATVAVSSVVAQPVSAQTSTVSDAVGDARFNAPAFQDIVMGQITKTASGDFALLMGLAGTVPAAPPMPPPANAAIFWGWSFDLDPASYPAGYPGAPGLALPAEFLVVVSWDGISFEGIAIDRRPLLTEEEAILTPVPFSINGTIVEAVLASSLIGNAPPSFSWGPRTVDWAGPVGSGGFIPVDFAETVFNP